MKSSENPVILHAVPSLGVDGGGPPRSVSQLCAHLAKKSCNVHLLTAVAAGEERVPVEGAVRLHTVDADTRTMYGRLYSNGFTRPVESIANQINVVHQHGIWLRSTHDTIRFAHNNNIKLIVAPRGMLEPWALQHRRWKKKLAWTLFQKKDLGLADVFHATALSEADSIRRLGFKQPIAVIPNGVDLEPAIERQPKSDNAPRTALFLSRINPKKGILMLLDAWKQVAPTGWRLVIAGNDDGNHLPDVQRKIHDLGLEQHVELPGPLYGKAKNAAFTEADLFVLPSFSENFGIVVAEALGYSIPVLTTTGCPWRELETERCGWWVDPKPESISEALYQALNTSSGELVEMGCRGRSLAESRYQWPAAATHMKRVYDWMMGLAERPDFVV